MKYGVPPDRELAESVYLDWLDDHPPVFGVDNSFTAGSLQCEFSSTLGIGRANEIVSQWQDINWSAGTQFDRFGYLEGSPHSVEMQKQDKLWQERDPEGHASYWEDRK